jgi:hypothetical protein
MRDTYIVPKYRIRSEDNDITVEHMYEHDFLPDYSVFNCWVSCNCSAGQPIDLVFDICDYETGVTFKNVKGQCNLNQVTFTLGPDVLPESGPTDLGEIKTFVCFGAPQDSDFEEAISEAVMQWCKNLFAGAKNQAASIPDFNEFCDEFNADPDEEGDEADDFSTDPDQEGDAAAGEIEPDVPETQS